MSREEKEIDRQLAIACRLYPLSIIATSHIVMNYANRHVLGFMSFYYYWSQPIEHILYAEDITKEKAKKIIDNKYQEYCQIMNLELLDTLDSMMCNAQYDDEKYDELASQYIGLS